MGHKTLFLAVYISLLLGFSLLTPSKLLADDIQSHCDNLWFEVIQPAIDRVILLSKNKKHCTAERQIIVLIEILGDPETSRICGNRIPIWHDERLTAIQMLRTVEKLCDYYGDAK